MFNNYQNKNYRVIIIIIIIITISGNIITIQNITLQKKKVHAWNKIIKNARINNNNDNYKGNSNYHFLTLKQ